MTAPILDKRITALENELTALRRRKLALLEAQLEKMGDGHSRTKSARPAEARSGRGKK